MAGASFIPAARTTPCSYHGAIIASLIRNQPRLQLRDVAAWYHVTTDWAAHGHSAWSYDQGHVTGSDDCVRGKHTETLYNREIHYTCIVLLVSCIVCRVSFCL